MAKGNPFGKKGFEGSRFDKDPKGVKEGSKADKALDRKQMSAAGFRRGGKAKGRK
jgi:hypothetical protein